MAAMENRLIGPFDVSPHLLDRQTVDCEDRLVGKVDDVELTNVGDRLQVTALLTGVAAVVTRLGGPRLVRRWRKLVPMVSATCQRAST